MCSDRLLETSSNFNLRASSLFYFLSYCQAGAHVAVVSAGNDFKEEILTEKKVL